MPTSEKADGGAQAASRPSGPGARLRQAREAQGLQIEEVANELRVGAESLAALEDNRFEALGAAVFARGYLKQYGTRLGLDARELLDLYERTAGESEIELAPNRNIRLRDERQISRWVVATLTLGLVIGGLAYWWNQAEVAPGPSVAVADAVANAGREAAAPAGSLESEAGSATVAPDEAVDESALEPADADVSAGANVNADADADASAGADTEGDAAAEANRAADVSLDVSADASPESGQALAALVAESPVPVIDGPVLEVIFVEDCWTEIADEDGSRLYRDLGRAGTRARFPADRNLSLYFGNASGIELRVDGEVVPVPGAARRDVVRFDLDDVID